MNLEHTLQILQSAYEKLDNEIFKLRDKRREYLDEVGVIEADLNELDLRLQGIDFTMKQLRNYNPETT